MQNLLEALKITLQSDQRLIVDGKLAKNKIVELALAMDEGLLALLLGNEVIKKQFFKDIEGVLVFDKVALQSFVSNKQFLPDSYTAFKNKIGLTANGEYLTESKEVVLAWPYKDCALEGGQTKEEQKRKEIFWNETLAPDEIDRLLDPKVLTHFKRYDKDGEHKVERVGLDDNLIIKGNNLLALHSLKKQYAGKVKLIYIDPPYNTGSDSFGYNDSFNHSTWLTFMRNRLEVARKLLRDDGVIFVQCDDNEQAYLKVLMDEVFGQDNFVNNISLRMSTSAGLKMSHKYKKLLKIKETILMYVINARDFELSCLDELYVDKPFYETERSDKYILNYEDNFNDWNFVSLHEGYKKFAKKDEPKISFVNRNSKRIFNHVINKSTKQNWDKLTESEKITYKNKVRAYSVEKSHYKYAYNDHVFIPYNPKILEGDLWNQNFSIGGTKTHEGGAVFTNGKKREVLLKRIIGISTQKDDIVLDYHLGSGTTVAVAHKMGRQYIGIEQMDYIETVAVERLKKVIAGEQGGISKSANWQGGGSFTYCELAQHNANIVDKIEQAKTAQALTKIWHEIENVDFISYKIKPEAINKNIHEFAALSIAEQKQFLIAVLDKNQLYVNYSEIEDADYQISDTDKKLNKQFYGG